MCRRCVASALPDRGRVALEALMSGRDMTGRTGQKGDDSGRTTLDTIMHEVDELSRDR